MLKKVLSYKKHRGILVIAFIALTLGTTLILSSLQLKSDVDYALAHSDDAFENHYLVLHKHVSDLNMFNLSKTTFSKEDIETLKNQPGITDVSEFKTGNNFEVMADLSVEGGNFPPFSTLAFFESIPTQFMDVDQQEWNWNENEQHVPIILPNSFLDAYNFGIAQTMNTPQLSKNFISSINFKLNIKGRGKQTTYFGNIVGFSDRVNSILVPENFLDYLNSNYGSSSSKSSRVIISTITPKDPQLNQFLEDNGYETNKELTKGTILEKSLGYIFPTLAGLGGIVVTLSFIIFILYLYLIINKNEINIGWLLIIGYMQKTIIAQLFKPIAQIYILISSVSLLITIVLKLTIINALIDQLDLVYTNQIAISVYETLGIILIFWLLLTFLSISRSVKNIS